MTFFYQHETRDHTGVKGKGVFSYVNIPIDIPLWFHKSVERWDIIISLKKVKNIKGMHLDHKKWTEIYFLANVYYQLLMTRVWVLLFPCLMALVIVICKQKLMMSHLLMNAAKLIMNGLVTNMSTKITQVFTHSFLFFIIIFLYHHQKIPSKWFIQHSMQSVYDILGWN